MSASTQVGYSSYKGNPMIVLGAESRFPFQFGPAKAQLIVEHMEAIKAFAAKHAKQRVLPGTVLPLMKDPGEDAADRYAEGGGGR